mmetsp:Transcript_17885/g.23137  ORF Transcript_17885/g.23137 Transcript_17885/m.23137 type:complete len:257 (-) Transcript_17885:62-832(-)
MSFRVMSHAPFNFWIFALNSSRQGYPHRWYHSNALAFRSSKFMPSSLRGLSSRCNRIRSLANAKRAARSRLRSVAFVTHASMFISFLLIACSRAWFCDPLIVSFGKATCSWILTSSVCKLIEFFSNVWLESSIALSVSVVFLLRIKAGSGWLGGTSTTFNSSELTEVASHILEQMLVSSSGLATFPSSSSAGATPTFISSWLNSETSPYMLEPKLRASSSSGSSLSSKSLASSSVLTSLSSPPQSLEPLLDSVSSL